MLELYKPHIEDLWLKEKLMNDEQTMYYNHAYGGTIPFPKDYWSDWYKRWIINHNNKCFYRYIKENDIFVGEVAYHFDGERKIYIADVIVYAPYRGKGYGRNGLLLLCEAAKENGLMEIKGSRIYLTERGSDYINGVIPLFYSERSKEELKTAFSKKSLAAEDDEKLFLSAYNANDYDRPSIAADLVVFSVTNQKDIEPKRSPEQKLKVLLIKRGEHPFMNHWALPGGFLKNDETMEECAFREVAEETNVSPKALLPIGVFSDPDRDVRTRVVSNAFLSVVDAEEYHAVGGDDAVAAEWFEVSFHVGEDNKITINLSKDDTQIECILEMQINQFGNVTYTILENGGLAFDHAKILATAFRIMRNQKDEYELVFRFLPKKFTLSSMQRVYEIINNIFDQPANFRRKAANYVVETDEYEDCIGHRPAKLYERKL